MNDSTETGSGGSDDTRDPNATPIEAPQDSAPVGQNSAPEGQDSASAEPWSPATDAGIPGNSAEEKPKVRKAPAPARGGDAVLRRRSEPARAARLVADPKPESEADEATPEGDRIAKVIARAGIASRRDVEAMIEQGRVSLNGKVLASPAINVTDADVIMVDGEHLPIRERTRLWIFHKPRGLVTTARDPEGRQTVFESLPEDLPRVVAIGRLDINTEGLLLLTNDGGLAKVIAHPDTGWLRRYRVRAHGDTSQAELDKLRKGVTIDGMDYGPIDAVLDRASGDNLWLTLGLREGKNREVKRILEHLGLAVNRLIRLSFGPFQLGDLEAGLVEEIRTKVLKEQLGPGLSSQADVDFESPVREPIAPFGSPKPQAKQPARSASAARGGDRRDDDEARRPPRSDFQRAPSRGGDRPVRPPAAPARVPTGGSSAGPRRSVWRAEEPAPADDGIRRVKIPRRGADPKVERETAAARGRERVGAIQTGERRVLVERLKATPQESAPEPHRRDRGARRDDTDTGPRAPRLRQDGPAARAPRAAGYGSEARGPAPRPPRREDGEARPARRFDGEGRPPRRDDAAPRPFRNAAAPGGERQDRPERRGPPAGAGERPRAYKPAGDREGGGFRDRGDKPSGFRADGPGGKPGGFKAGGFKPGGSKPGGFKPGGKPGGFKAGGFKDSSPRTGAERGGAERTGGERAGGERGGFKAGAKPGGFKGGGGKPGGFGARGGGGGKPGGRPGGAGRPPRGGPR